MIVTHQLGLSGLFNHRPEKQSAHLVVHQPVAVLAEYRGIENLFNQFHIQKSAKQKIVPQLLAKLPLAPDRVKPDQEDFGFRLVSNFAEARVNALACRAEQRITSKWTNSLARSTGERYPIGGIFFGCCASITATATTSTKAMTESPSHFRFRIADFGLSKGTSKEMRSSVCSLRFQSKI
jgi:hypothetical protein